MVHRLFFLSLVILPLISRFAAAVEHVTLERDGQKLHVSGKLLVEAEDGGVLVLAPDGALWAVQPEELVERKKDSEPFKPLGRKQLIQNLLEEMPAGFRIHETAHYLICYNTSPTYAQWCGSLFERLHRAFNNYWNRRGFRLHDSDFPLVALVFDQKTSYEKYAAKELGAATPNIPGYYSPRSNRVATYDLTGVERLKLRGKGAEHINRILMQPGAERTVATIVHEATHQVAFNCGLQTRYADNPKWVSEGMAIYFETPDLKSSKGWRTIGGVNRYRFSQFRRYLRTRPADSLATLIGNDQRFLQARTADAAYAEAWSLNYFLLRKYAKQYRTYLKQLADKSPLLYDTPQERVKLFTEAIGENLESLDKEFLLYMKRVK